MSVKQQLYRDLAMQTQALLSGETNLIANMANFSALLYQRLPDVNWVGFYLLDGDQLVLGPFQGSPACVRIAVGKGVCGTAASQGEALVVNNVHEFAGHIACDTASNAELVIPFYHQGTLFGVLDIDSPVLHRFDMDDQQGCMTLLTILSKSCIAI